MLSLSHTQKSQKKVVTGSLPRPLALRLRVSLHSLTHALTHSLTRTHSRTHSPTHAPTHSRTHPLTHPPTHSLTHPPTHSLTHPLTHCACGQPATNFIERCKQIRLLHGLNTWAQQGLNAHSTENLLLSKLLIENLTFSRPVSVF